MDGLLTIWYYRFFEVVAFFTELHHNQLALEESIVITGDIVMKPGKQVHRMYGTAETGGLNGESEG